MRDIEDTCKVLSVCSEGLTALHMVGCSSNLKTKLNVLTCLCMPTTISSVQTSMSLLLVIFKDLAVQCQYISIKLL